MRTREVVEAELEYAFEKCREGVGVKYGTWCAWFAWDYKRDRLKRELAAIIAAEKEAGK